MVAGFGEEFSSVNVMGEEFSRHCRGCNLIVICEESGDDRSIGFEGSVWQWGIGRSAINECTCVVRR